MIHFSCYLDNDFPAQLLISLGISEYIIGMGEMELIKAFNDPTIEIEKNENLSLDDKLQMAKAKVQSNVEKQPELNRFKDAGLELA